MFYLIKPVIRLIGYSLNDKFKYQLVLCQGEFIKLYLEPMRI